MIRIISLAVILACITSVHLLAFNGITSSTSYRQIHMKRGRYVDKIWVGPEFNKTYGFTVSDVRYSVKVTNDTVVDYLPAAFNSLENSNSLYSLVVTVVEFSERVNSVRPYNSNRIRIDGKIFNHRKEPVAAFQVDRTFPISVVDTKFAIDDIVRAVKRELR
jgi:hypothetical protein